MKTIKRAAYLLALGLSVFANFFFGYGTLAVITQIGVWSYATYFGSFMIIVNLVHLVVLPMGDRYGGSGWAWLDGYLTFDHARLARRPWSTLRRRGAFIFTIAAAVFLGPAFIPVCFRLFSIPERRRWGYAFVGSVAASVVWVSLYLGVAQAVILVIKNFV